MPPRFGKGSAVYQRFRRWVKSGVFGRRPPALSDERALATGRVDGTFIKVHQRTRPASSWGDKAQVSDAGRQALASEQIIATIPGKANRKGPAEFDDWSYQGRHLIEKTWP